MSTSISNGRPEDKELTRRMEALKKEFAEKRKRDDPSERVIIIKSESATR